MSKFATHLEDGYEKCPFCRKPNHIGFDIHCRHYLGIELEGTIYHEATDDLMNIWSELEHEILPELQDLKRVEAFYGKVKKPALVETISKIIAFLKSPPYDSAEILFELVDLKEGEGFSNCGLVAASGRSFYIQRHSKVARLSSVLKGMRDRGQRVIQRAEIPLHKPKQTKSNESLRRTRTQQPDLEIEPPVVWTPDNRSERWNPTLSGVRRALNIEGQIELVGYFYQGYCSISLETPCRRNPRIKWETLFKRELGMVPKTERDWEVVYLEYGLLPPILEGLRQKLEGSLNMGSISSLKDLVPIPEDSWEPGYSRPTEKAKAYDIIRAIISEGLPSSDEDDWSVDAVLSDNGFPKDIQRHSLIRGRSRAYRLRSAIIKRHKDINLRLPKHGQPD
jgi:hypothetical protein